MRRTIALCTLLLSLGAASTAEAARNFQLRGKNDLCGGIGFGAGLTDRTPGGFKWFNEYSREISRLVWLNVPFNVTVGDYGRRWGGWCYDRFGRPYNCGWAGGWGGVSLDLGFGVKLKWRATRIPLQFHAKMGGILTPLFWEWAKGVAFGYRGGFGIRYFVLPMLGVGAEFIHSIGPAWVNNNVGTGVYASIDFNTGIEFRF